MADHMESFKPDLRMLIEGKGQQVVHIKLGGEARKYQKVRKKSRLKQAKSRKLNSQELQIVSRLIEK